LLAFYFLILLWVLTKRRVVLHNKCFKTDFDSQLVK
jgi:hypothetical protein